MGSINATKGQIMSLTITKKVTQYGEYNLIPASVVGFLCGTEVTLNGRNKGKNTITQGFTRLIYLTDEDSRLDYDWYSGNSKMAIITDYGTVLGLPMIQETLVKIIAVKEVINLLYLLRNSL